MAKVNFGIFYMRADPSVNPLEFAKKVEGMGLDGFWTGETPTNRGPSMDTFATLCFAAAGTSKIKIGSNVILLPMHHPAWVAKEWGTLDILSKGRSILTVGPGGEYPIQFTVFGVKHEERGKRTDECLEVIKNLWTEKESNYNGKFFQFQGITMEPKPLTKPHPPIWVGGRPGGTYWDTAGSKRLSSKTAAMRRAAKYGDGWCPHYLTPQMFKETVEQVKAYAAEAGRDVSKMELAFNVNLFIRDTFEEGLAAAQKMMRYGRDLSGKVGQYDIYGGPKDVIKRIEEYAEAGVRHLVLHVNSEPGGLDHDLQLLAREVRPHFLS